MKNFRRLMALVLAVVMVLGTMSLTAFAADNGKLTVDNATKGEEYNLYKVFDLTYSGADEASNTSQDSPAVLKEGVAYTYTKNGAEDAFLTALTAEGSPFQLTETTTSGKYNVALKAGKTAENIAAFLNDNKAGLQKIGETKTAAGTSVEWTGLAYGYYYVTSGLGATVTIDSTMKEVTVKDKNTVPSVDKKQSTTAGSYADAAVNVKIGDTVYYETTITDGKGTNKDIIMTDTMSAGLTFNQDSITVKKNGETVAASDTTYAVTDKTDRGFTLTLKASYVGTLSEADTVVITYTAKLNKDAVTVSEEGTNTNTAKLTYSNQTEFTSDTVEVETCKFQLVKDDKDKKLLTGAKFRLYDAENGGNEIPVVKTADGSYRVAEDGETGVEIEAGTPVIRGLAKATYYLEETAAPSGYNPLAERKSIALTGDNPATLSDADEDGTIDTYVSGGLEVVNQSGTELPSTGGMGTTIFYIAGAALVVGALVLLIARKRASREDAE